MQTHFLSKSRGNRWLKTMRTKRDKEMIPVSNRLASTLGRELSSSSLKALSLHHKRTKGLCITSGLF